VVGGPAGHSRRQCRHLESSDDRGDDRVEDFDKLFAVNVRAPFFSSSKLLPILGSGAASSWSRRS